MECLDRYMWAEVLKEENIVKDSKRVVYRGWSLLVLRGKRMEMIEKTLTLKGFKDSPIEIYTDTRVTKVRGDNRW